LNIKLSIFTFGSKLVPRLTCAFRVLVYHRYYESDRDNRKGLMEL